MTRAGQKRIDAPRLLVLGGSRFVGLALVEAAVRQGWSVTTFNDDRQSRAIPGVEQVLGDRRRACDLAVLRKRRWDAIVDTWQGSPAAVAHATCELGHSCAHYAYVSSVAVDDVPLTRLAGAARPMAADHSSHYAARKAGGELAVTRALGERALVVRAGLVLGPHEYPGRLPWWLFRLQAGGEVLAPGPRDRWLQYVDARDLAAWMLVCAERQIVGTYHLACPRGHATMSDLLEACSQTTTSRATLCWVPGQWLEQAGVRPWTELPIWVSDRDGGSLVYQLDVSQALDAGASFRSVAQTVADTWAWLRALDSGALGQAVEPRARLTRSKERRILMSWWSAAGVRQHTPQAPP